ncbi:2OG-Fe(II) oxygenase family protein [Sphingomonas sp. MG17]|uniref:2OG-Fe(II) oxygenase family protein n=1 Tax=Sphingomonas tagetis TaxID=2949092 RepID=A0A9X2KLZ8_9SPHN|nr:putative 2OG-Fe(II) oxygenase [Sphingomonas tagetis]MCP3730931.1 2OG-Fe(II) oxygenase family protein [Sphingomonas tagetis]
MAGYAQLRALWPYVSLAWRVTGDPRFDWLAGDAGLVGVFDLDIAALIDPLAAFMRSRHRAQAAPAGQSVRGGTQTAGPLFTLEAAEIRQLRAVVLAAVERHVAAMGGCDPRHPTRQHIGRPLRFAGSWSVRLTGAGHHSNHIHPQGWISSALYVAVPSQAEMGPAPNGWLQLGQPPPDLAGGLEPCRRIEPKPGRLVLFPSCMWHGTQPIDGGERLTVAFDVAAVGP